MFKSIGSVILVATLLLAACGASPATEPTLAPSSTPAATATSIPTTTPALVATDLPQESSTAISLAEAETRPSLLQPYGENPVVAHGPITEWDGSYTDPGAVLYHDGKFHMFRNGFRAWPASVQIGYVTSADGYTWVKQGEQPVLTTAEVPYAGIAALASSALVLDDGSWVLYFYTWEQNSFPSSGSIGRATAKAPTGPWTIDPAPVLRPGNAGEWDELQVSTPDVQHTPEGFVMYYSGANKAGIQMIGRATSSNGIDWVKYNNPSTAAPFAESDAVFKPDQPKAWDAAFVHQPRVAHTPEGWVMLYRGVPEQRSNKMALGVAISADGIDWGRVSGAPVLTRKALAKADAFWFTSMVYRDGTYFLFWEVEMRRQTNIHLATYTGEFWKPKLPDR